MTWKCFHVTKKLEQRVEFSVIWDALLTRWSRVMHMCIGNLASIGSDNGLSPGRRQAIMWTNARILLNWHTGTIFRELLMEILTVSFRKMRLKGSFAKWRPCCLDFNVLMRHYCFDVYYIHGYRSMNGYFRDVHVTKLYKSLYIQWEKYKRLWSVHQGKSDERCYVMTSSLLLLHFLWRKNNGMLPAWGAFEITRPNNFPDVHVIS